MGSPTALRKGIDRLARAGGTVGRIIAAPILVPLVLVLIGAICLWDPEVGVLRRNSPR
jgi:hypothetical protein